MLSFPRNFVVMLWSHLSCKTEHIADQFFYRTHNMWEVSWVSIHNELEQDPKRAALWDRVLLLIAGLFLGNWMIHVLMFSNFAWCFCCFWLFIFCLIFCASVSDASWISCFIILVERCFDKIKEYSYSWFEISAKIGIISPLILKGMIIASSWYQNNVSLLWLMVWIRMLFPRQVGLADQKC